MMYRGTDLDPMSFWDYFFTIVCILLVVFCFIKICHASESPQSDLYKIDSSDWYFNHQGDYYINQPEINTKAKGSDGERLIAEADEFERRLKGGK